MADLGGLWYDICSNGLKNLCGRCFISTDDTKIFMTYRDKHFNEQFIFVERFRRSGYRISLDKKVITVRTEKAAYVILDSFLQTAVSASERYGAITVAEYANLIGRIRLSDYWKLTERLDQRLSDKERYEEYLKKTFPKGDDLI